MLTFTSEQARRIVKDAYPGDNTVSQAVHELDFLEFSNLEESVKADVQFLKENDLVPKETTITGWIYDVDTGKVKQSSLPQETCVLTLLLRLVRLRSSYPVPSNLIPDVLSTVTLCFQVLVTIPYPNMFLSTHDFSCATYTTHFLAINPQTLPPLSFYLKLQLCNM